MAAYFLAGTLASALPTLQGQLPLGVYLWYPVNQKSQPTDDECRALVANVRPSRKKANDWLWGRVPEDDSRVAEFYLFLTASRMDPTFAAEGDYDAGAVTYGVNASGTTSFKLVPDDHPGTIISGTIVSNPGSQMLSVILNGIPQDDGGVRDRTTHYCHFAEEMET